MQGTSIFFLNSVFIPIFLAIISALLTAKVALKSFRSQRWWERKADAYSRIVESLHDLMEYHSAMSDESMTGAERNEAQFAQLRGEYEKAYRDLRKVTGIGAYIISDEVAQVLAALDARPRPQWKPAVPPWELYDAEFDAYKTALMQIRQLAKKDLHVR